MYIFWGYISVERNVDMMNDYPITQDESYKRCNSMTVQLNDHIIKTTSNDIMFVFTSTNSLANFFQFEYFRNLRISVQKYFDPDSNSPHMS